MSEIVYIRDRNGELVKLDTGRDPTKMYSDIGKTPEGVTKLREWSDKEMQKRATEEAEWAATPPPPPKRSLEERLLEIEARLAALEK